MNKHYFEVDWLDFKNAMFAELEDDSSKWRSSRNSTAFHGNVNAGGSWHGYTSGQVREWLKTGYMPSEIVAGLAALVPPTENRTSILWDEEEGEFHVDLAMSGEDECYSMPVYEKRAYGCRIEAGIMFSASTPADTIREYMIWIARTLWTLESQGVNCSLLLDFPSRDCITKSGMNPCEFHSLVRVKRESTYGDFRGWSAMVSPAALRNFGFALIDLHADSINGRSNSSYGRGMPDRVDWKVGYDKERKVISIENSYSPLRAKVKGFPKFDMDQQLKAAIEEMRDSQ
jgi:hypothetical protein